MTSIHELIGPCKTNLRGNNLKRILQIRNTRVSGISVSPQML